LRAKRLEDEQHFIAFNQLSRLLNSLGRTETIVIADEVDLAAVDAAFSVDLVEIAWAFPITP